MKTKINDFVEIEYNAFSDNNQLFDTTNENTAKEHKIYSPKIKYGPVIICIGTRQVIKGLDEALVNKDVPSEFTIDIEPENAYGKKDPKLIKLISKNVFSKNKITPVPNLKINVDGMIGIVKTVSGGRITVDFNHPLANKKVKYEIKINKIIQDLKEKIDSFLELTIKSKSSSIKESGKEIEVKIKSNINQEILNNIASHLSKILNKDVSIVVE